MGRILIMLKTIGLIITTALMMVLCLQPRSLAQVTVNLQADVSNLRSQVSQLRAEVAQLRSQRVGAVPATPATPRRTRSPELTDDQIVDRLAILAIEAKDRLNALESRVAKLERSTR
jgi:outer membrane murein-binding lipoprotein Lpp